MGRLAVVACVLGGALLGAASAASAEEEPDRAFATLAAAAMPGPVASPGRRSLREAFDALPGAAGRGTCRLLSGNGEAWAARWWALSQARRTVDTTYYILTRDVFGVAFVGYLYRHARAGRAVRLMVDSAGDATGTRGFEGEVEGREYLRELVRTGRASVHVYRPVHWRVGSLLAGQGFTKAVAGNHDKLLIVDGRLGVTGGRNVSRDYFASPADHGESYRDADVLVDAPSVAQAFTAALASEYDLAGTVSSVTGREPLPSTRDDEWPPPSEGLGRHDVELLLVTNSPASTDSVLTQLFFVREWPRLMARVPTLRLRVAAGRTKQHAKEAVFDDTVSLVGSFNLDFISALSNGECVVAAWSPSLASDVMASVEADFDDPGQSFKEYLIACDGAGAPVMRDGEPVVAYGPGDHLGPGTWAFYRAASALVGSSRDELTRLPSAVQDEPSPFGY